MAARVCHVSTVHGGADVRIFHKECKSLATAGYETYFVVKADGDTVIDGVRILALPRPRSRFERFTRLIWLAYSRALASGADLYHIHDPELIPLGIMFKLRRKKVIWDAHEDVPKQILSKQWIPGFLRRPVALAVGLLERQAAKVFDGVVAATPSIARRFPLDKTVVVQNFPRLQELVRVCDRPYRDRPNRIIYIGGISRARGIMELLDAMVIANEQLPVRLDLAGVFDSTELYDVAREHPGWKYVDYHGWLERDRVMQLLCRARVGVVTLHNTPNHFESYPIKMFEYMAAGLSVVASDFPLWKKIGREAGLFVDPQDPQAIARAIEWLLAHPQEAEAMGRRGQEAVRERYNWDREKEKLLALYEELLS